MPRALVALALLCSLAACDQNAQRDNAALRDEIAHQSARIDELTQRMEQLEHSVRRTDSIMALVTQPPANAAPLIRPTAPTPPEVPFTARCDASRNCKVPRAAVESLLARPEAVVKAARVIPSIKEGVAEGVKLFAIGSDSPLHALGLTNGDLIRTINGLEISDASRALEAYAALRKATSLTIEGERGGQPMRIVVTIE